MTDDQGLFQAILDNPDDNAVRLVYADWLEEHGQPARADFIRVQVELAHLPPNDPRRGELEAREQALLNEHEKEWAEPLRPWAIRWAFRRGFVEEVTVPAQVYLDHTATLTRLAPIRRFVADLSESAIPQDILEQVPEAVARELVALPLGRRGRTLVVAMRDPENAEATRKLAFILNRDIDAVAAPPEQLSDVINRSYDGLEVETVVTTCFIEEDPVEFDVANDHSPVARLVSLIVQEALSLGATEVRIEPEDDVLHVRYRINGEMVERDNPPRHLLDGIVERVRFLTAHPSRLRAACGGLVFDLGVSIQATDHGPLVVITL
jgi:uncharacterized protein (TIGR02996 family)